METIVNCMLVCATVIVIGLIIRSIAKTEQLIEAKKLRDEYGRKKRIADKEAAETLKNAAQEAERIKKEAEDYLHQKQAEAEYLVEEKAAEAGKCRETIYKEAERKAREEVFSIEKERLEKSQLVLQQAEEVKSDAEKESEILVVKKMQEVEENAISITDKANRDASDLIIEKRREAKEILSKAKKEAQHLIEEAKIIANRTTKMATEEPERMIEDARRMQALIAPDKSQVAEFREKLAHYCIAPATFSLLRDVPEGMKDDAMYRVQLAGNKKYQKESKDYMGTAVNLNKDYTLCAYNLMNVGLLMTDYFDVLAESLISKVMKYGFAECQHKLLQLKMEIESYIPAGAEMKIKDEYMRLKMEQLELTYKRGVLAEQAKARQKEEAERRREEIQLQREYERELKRAKKDEESAQEALERARQRMEVEAEHSAERARLQAQIDKLQDSLEEARRRAERAQSMAQQTRSGYVYVISNIGSFGEGVYKIGMTRRIDPMERVIELGDASVPFPFDVHAMIYSEDAPALENALHKAFDDRKLNMVNGRKEFFRVSLEEIKEKVRNSGIDAQFVDEPLAQQWRDSQMMLPQIA